MRARRGSYNKKKDEDEKPEPDVFLPGIITDLNTQTRNVSRVSVFIDGTFRFGCYKAVFLESGLRKSQELSIPAYEKLMLLEERFRLREYWLDLLSRRAHTGTELRRKAIKKGFSSSFYDEILNEFREKKYIDESAYARAYIRETYRNKKWGAARMRMELKKRGVPDVLIEHALEDEIPDDQFETMRLLVQKNHKRFLRESDILKRRKKIFDHLVRKGYSAAEVLQHLDLFLKQLSNDDI